MYLEIEFKKSDHANDSSKENERYWFLLTSCEGVGRQD